MVWPNWAVHGLGGHLRSTEVSLYYYIYTVTHELAGNAYVRFNLFQLSWSRRVLTACKIWTNSVVTYV